VSRRIDPKVVFTLAFVLGLLGLAALRMNGWRLPSWSEWGRFQFQRISSSPEDAIYTMLDAARAGKTKAYLDAFSGPIRDQLLQAVKESSESKFASYLTAQNADFQGVAITIVERPSSEEARAKVEYVYTDRNETQNLYLKQEGNRWKILKVAGSDQLKTVVPYGGVSD
jgi:hypothetical protein